MPRLSALMLILIACTLPGCGPKEEIRTYAVPRPSKPTVEAKVRFLGAIVPIDGEYSCFVRFLGPVEVVNPMEADFDKLLNSIRIVGKLEKPVEWTAPEGWKLGEPRQLRLVTFTRTTDSGTAEIYISEPTKGSNLANINRWRTDFVGIPAITQPELATTTTEVKLGAVTAVRVDLRGPGTSKKPRPPFAGS